MANGLNLHLNSKKGLIVSQVSIIHLGLMSHLLCSAIFSHRRHIMIK